MRIITPGSRVDQRWPYDTEVTCWNCGCVFQLEPGDRFRDEPMSEGVTVRCPQEECGVPVTIKRPADARTAPRVR